MSFLKSVFGDKNRKLLLEMIEHNADIIERDEKRSRVDAEYLSICLVLDDLSSRPNGKVGHQAVMDILTKEYSQHHNDVMTYLAVESGMIKLKPEAEEQLIERHRKR